jgi:hypothetical protein
MCHMDENAPPLPEPDAKDWTWVLDAVCPDCEYVAGDLDISDLGDRLRNNAAKWALVLQGDSVALGQRPEALIWSPLEYACHVRDVYVLFLERLELMLTSDDARFANWDQDLTAAQQRYDLAVAADVLPALVAAGEKLAARFDEVSGAQWSRVGFRSDGATFTVESFGRYLLHDPVHHLHDVGFVSG